MDLCQRPCLISSSHSSLFLLTLPSLQADIYTAKFSPSGNTLASGSQDRRICEWLKRVERKRRGIMITLLNLFLPPTLSLHQVLWNTYGDCENYAMLTGHTNAILELQWSADGK